MHLTHQNVTINNIKLNSLFDIENNHSSYAYVINLITMKVDHESMG